MRQRIVRRLLQTSLIVLTSLASIEAAGAAPIHPAIPPIIKSSGLLQQVARSKIPSLNGYRGDDSARPGYVKSSNGYWYPSRAFDDYTGSIRRPQRMSNSCDYGFAPTNGSGCNY